MFAIVRKRPPCLRFLLWFSIGKPRKIIELLLAKVREEKEGTL